METMTVQDNENDDISDNDVPENVHNRLLGAISNLYKQKRVKAPVRNESSLQVSEFHLSSIRSESRKTGKIEVSELARVLDKKGGHAKINEQIKNVKKQNKKLAKPLEKLHAEKIERSVGYDNVRKDLSKWDPIVYHQRVAEHVSFPLKGPKMEVHNNPYDFLNTFKTPTELELKLAESLNASELLKKEKEEEDVKDIQLSLEEIKEKRYEMARLRAQLSYREAKAARQNRIKSKRFHRIQRKEKIKMQLKEFEELQKTDPEAALKKLEQLEKARAQERASLRHRTTGQWARNVAVRAKYNKEARIELSEQLSKSRELTQKIKVDSDTESENLSEDEDNNEILNDTDNSWLSKKPSNEVEEFYASFKRYEMDKSKKSTSKPTLGVNFEENGVSDKGNDKNEAQTSLNDSVIQNYSRNIASENSPKKKTKGVKRKLDGSEKTTSPNNFCVEEDINPNKNIEVKFSVITKKLKNKKTRKSDEHSVSVNNVLKTKLPLKSGIWSVEDVKEDCNKFKQTKKSSSGIGKSQQDSKVSDSSIQSKNGIIKSKKKKPSSYSKVKKLKIHESSDLDNLFCEVEDKLLDKVKNKVTKLKNNIETDNLKNLNSFTESSGKKHRSMSKRQNNSDLALKKQRIEVEVDEELGETTLSVPPNDKAEDVINKLSLKPLSSLDEINVDNEINSKKLTNVEPDNFFLAKPKQLKTEVPSNFTGAEDTLDDLDDESNANNDKSMTISEAFACDDVDEEFKKDKDEEVKQSLVEDVNLVLPGWGSWGGPKVDVPSHKKKRFIFKFPKQMPRRDENKGNLVINEDKDETIKPHLVTDLPFPFTSVKEYEASIRVPMGRTWLPQTAHRKLITPAVTTKLGTIIEPMTKDQILKNK